MICFECHKSNDRVFQTGGYFFCWPCVRNILEQYAHDNQKYEQHLDERAEAEKLSNKLGYQWRCISCGTFNDCGSEDPAVCWKCLEPMPTKPKGGD